MQTQELARFSLFREMTLEQLAYLAPRFSRVTFKAGETLFAQGHRAETVYVLRGGSVALQFQPEDGERLTIDTLHPSSVLGWSAVLGRPYYTSSAICITPAQAIAISGEKLRALIRVKPELSFLLGRMALNVANRQVGALSQIIGLINEELNHAGM
jgi:CRP/FNR family transcriptional regulator, cyclic AMP receptor protein